MNDDLRELADDYLRHVEATGKSPQTLAYYRRALAELFRFLELHSLPTGSDQVNRRELERFIVWLSNRESRRDPGRGISRQTVIGYYRALRTFWAWMVTIEEELDRSPFERMRAPRPEYKPVPILQDDELQALIAACRGNTFAARRDLAIIRFLMDTGVRRSEIHGLTVRDLDFKLMVATVTGKGNRQRMVPFGNRTAEALRRYLRARRRHPFAAETEALWLGRVGPLQKHGIRDIIRRRADDAGVPNVHLHRFRHTASHLFMANGGQETDLARLNGWTSTAMAARYGASAAEERAIAAHRRAALGDRF
ncbi:tyrosine-type recombinase/integrase [Pseudonocardia sp. NPDC046786]|uniref:tyrosine-type recombinase/integrase n=1 Tax=Pseudonocardia sp. NPDC046786 TaxID=3155471 RepID=UPI0033F471A7